MIKYFVYLDTNVNRLIIVNEPINKISFRLLMDNNGIDTSLNRQLLLTYCKMFCIGYMVGVGKNMPINDINEFR